MTPQELHAALDARRRELGMKWWQVEMAVQAPAPSSIRRMRDGTLSAALRVRVEAWLETGRLPGPQRKE
ncbi:hypothetical protein [Microtetraspora glauca]|uniref:XRE family transcriptional regulator n=1 Tax=Microtetraspora glauca TaxID=1996 RepID=A0ABV3GA41_MICGL